MSDELGVTTYQYDTLYRLVTVTNPFSGTVGYGYDLAGNRTRLIYPDHREVIYTYDGDYRMVQVEDWAEGLTSYAYDAAGRLITTTLPNGAISVNNYDAANRLTRLAHEESGSETLLAEFRYQLDGVGNRAVATETLRMPAVMQVLTQTLTGSSFMGSQTNPAVTYNHTDDEYLVAWRSPGFISPMIMGRFLAGSGAPIDNAFVIGSNGSNPAVAYSPTDHVYLVVWQDSKDIWARTVSVRGEQGVAFRVFEAPTGSIAGEPDVVYNANADAFMVVWHQETAGGSSGERLGQRIWSRFVWSSGSMAPVVIVAQQSTVLAQPAVAVAGDGTHLVVWRDGRNLNGDIYGQRLSIPGGLQGGNIAISNAAGDESRPVLAWSTTGDHYLVVWQHDGTNEVRGQRVAADGTLAGAPINLSETGATARPAVTTTAGKWLVAWEEGNDLYGRFVGSEGNLDGMAVPLVAEAGIQSAPALAGGTKVYGLLVWQDNRNRNQDIYSGAVAVVSDLQTTTIEYEYDPLYRLTGAAYTGAITATFTYLYDAVGNMTAYTETIGAETTSVVRKFDAASRLETSDDGRGETSYTYDDNGNLTAITGTASGQSYHYDQRNLLTGITTGPLEFKLLDYVYDGAAN
jgi:YD repeat-containing protein